MAQLKESDIVPFTAGQKELHATASYCLMEYLKKQEARQDEVLRTPYGAGFLIDDYLENGLANHHKELADAVAKLKWQRERGLFPEKPLEMAPGTSCALVTDTATGTVFRIVVQFLLNENKHLVRLDARWV